MKYIHAPARIARAHAPGRIGGEISHMWGVKKLITDTTSTGESTGCAEIHLGVCFFRNDSLQVKNIDPTVGRTVRIISFLAPY